MHSRFVDYLVCPKSKSPLKIKSIFESDGSFIKEGVLVSKEGIEYPVRGWIPRFSEDDYTENFSLEWKKHPLILDELSSGYSLYRKRFRDETKWGGGI
jgi:uncharacterized protein YbaR (Trm112 family)